MSYFDRKTGTWKGARYREPRQAPRTPQEARELEEYEERRAEQLQEQERGDYLSDRERDDMADEAADRYFG